MSRYARRTALMVLAVVILGASSSLVQTQPPSSAVRLGELYRKLTAEIHKGMAAQAVELGRQVRDLTQRRDVATGAERQRLTEELAKVTAEWHEVRDAANAAQVNKKAQEFYKGLTAVHVAVDEMQANLSRGNRWSGNIVDLDVMTAHKLFAVRDMLDKADFAAGFYTDALALNRSLRRVNELAPTPQMNQMVESLGAALMGMKWVGKFCPPLTVYLDEYAKVGQGLLEATARLERKFADQRIGLMVHGRPDDGRVKAFERQFSHLTENVAMYEVIPLWGIRDAYELPSGAGVAIWSPGEGKWIHSDLPGLEVLKRYAFLAAYGNLNPTPGEVLADKWGLVIGLRVSATPDIVEPGGVCEIRVTAARVDGTLPPETLGAHLAVREESSLLGGGTVGKLSKVTVDPDHEKRENVSYWTAPDEENMVYEVTVSLPADEDVYRSAGDATCLVATAGRSALRVRADPKQVEPGGDGMIEYDVVNSEDKPVKPLGSIVILRSAGLEVESPEWRKDNEASGWAAYHAPQEPGVYRARVQFGGYMDAAWWGGENYMPCEGETTVTVVAAEVKPEGLDLTSLSGKYDDTDMPYGEVRNAVMEATPEGLKWTMVHWVDQTLVSKCVGLLTHYGRSGAGDPGLSGDYVDEVTGGRGWARTRMIPQWTGGDKPEYRLGDIELYNSKPADLNQRGHAIRLYRRPE